MASESHLARLKEGALAWNSWRRAEPLVRPDLQGIALSPAEKQWGETSGGPINLSHSSLREADLRYATLIRADLGSTLLNGANLSGARLQHADLRNANLSGARFDDADFTDALLDGANLSGADLSGARNLTASQLAAAEGDARTLLPTQVVMPNAWRNGAVARPAPQPQALEEIKPARATRVVRAMRTRTATPVIEHFANSKAAASARFGEVARRMGAHTHKVAVAANRIPWAVRLRNVPEPMLILGAGFGAVVLFVGLFGAYYLFSSTDDSIATAAAPSPTVAAHPQPPTSELDAGDAKGVAAGPAIADTDEEPPQWVTVSALKTTVALRDFDREAIAPEQLTVAPVGAKAAIQEVHERAQLAPVASRVVNVPSAGPEMLIVSGIQGSEVRKPAVTLLAMESPSTQPVPVESLPDPTIRLAFAAGSERMAPGLPNVGNTARTFIESYLGQPVETRSIGEPMDRTDLPTPTVMAKTAEGAGESETPKAPTNVVEYLSSPTRSTQWVRTFILGYYLSGAELSEDDVRSIYADKVDYFGTREMSLARVAREKASYYRAWPDRHYHLIADSIAIKWKSAAVVDVSFLYDFKVSAPNKKPSSGRGRARVTLDLSGASGRIVREDGEVLGQN